MRSENKTNGQEPPSFIEAARRKQIIACTIETIAELGYAQASLAQIAKRAGISKGVISYHFAGKDELIEQVVNEIYLAGITFMAPRMEVQTTVAGTMRVYIEANIDFIDTHRKQVIVLVDIMAHMRTSDGKLRYDAQAEEPILALVEAMLQNGQERGEFRLFHPRVMAVLLRKAIDALPALLVAKPDLDLEPYKRELVTVFDLATRKHEE